VAQHDAASEALVAPAAPAETAKAYVAKADCPLPTPASEPVADAVGRGPETTEEDATVEDEALAARAHALFNVALDGQRFDEALACAQVVSRLAPEDATGHMDRALALDSLGQRKAAHHAYERAVALAPDSADVLLSAADFLARSTDDDALETAVLYARRGRATASATMGAQLAGIEARALNDLGRSQDALRAAETSLALNSDGGEALVERAVSLFELLRFDEASKALKAAHDKEPKSARVAWYLGLLAERQGRATQADAYLAEATRLDPDTYPAPMAVTAAEFQKVVDDEIKRLTPELRHDLSTTRFSWADVPDTSDLKAGDPVLSPEIVGVYRPGDPGQADAILIYRKNLLRVAHTPQELQSEVRDTLLHELGHLHGKDDEELRDRGL
jgi:tetratricopeptide (TPR) repeat protein